MTGIHQTARKRTYVGAFDATAFSASDGQSEATSSAYADFFPGGDAILSGNISKSPTSPHWWVGGTPPPAWMEYSSTGSGIIIGGLSSGVRYELNVTRRLGIQRAVVGLVSRTFTISFYDSASGGTLLGTKTFVADAEVS